MNAINPISGPENQESCPLALLLSQSGCEPLSNADLEKFAEYLRLILRWNAKTNLTSIRDEDGIRRRHFLESITCAQALPEGVGCLLDFGSGAGFPGIPIAICRPEIQVTLAESQNKKAAFLREVISVLGLKATVHSGRAETLDREFDCVTMRAVDDMERSVDYATSLVRSAGLLAVMTTTAESGKLRARLPDWDWKEPISLPGSNQQELRFAIKVDLTAS